MAEQIVLVGDAGLYLDAGGVSAGRAMVGVCGIPIWVGGAVFVPVSGSSETEPGPGSCQD